MRQREGDAISGRHPDQRRAAHLHVADRVRHLGKRTQPQDAVHVRQRRLVDDVDGTGVGHWLDRSRRRAID